MPTSWTSPSCSGAARAATCGPCLTCACTGEPPYRSAGFSGDQIVCPYHGWRYAADGRCVAIPQLEDPARVPAKARVAAFKIQERYGLIWVAWQEPRWPLPELPELEDASWAVVSAGPYRWQSDAARQIENFTDFGHFPWVHPGLLGDPARPVVPRHEVRTEGHVLHYSIVRPETPNSDDFRSSAMIS